MQEGNLYVDSCMRKGKIYTFSQNIVIKKFGSVKIEIIESVNRLIKIVKCFKPFPIL
jgi:mRNA interferase MazF